MRVKITIFKKHEITIAGANGLDFYFDNWRAALDFTEEMISHKNGAKLLVQIIDGEESEG